MSARSSSAAAWSTHLEPSRPVEDIFRRADDPRLGEVIVRWDGDPAALTPGRAVLVGFPQDEGVRRNHGRPGAALAPHEIRHCLYRLTPTDVSGNVDLAARPPLDAGNVQVQGTLEWTQENLAKVVAGILTTGAVPVILGGGHETAYGHYLGYTLLSRPVGIVNIDAHLDVRPWGPGVGHSGSPFRQALEHPTQPLSGSAYVCLGALPQAVSREHWDYAAARGCVVHFADSVRGCLARCFIEECTRLARERASIMVTIDADVVAAAEVPGVSAPNPLGLAGAEVFTLARFAGKNPHVASLDLVEISPPIDRDRQSSRWAAHVLWNFLMGLAERPA